MEKCVMCGQDAGVFPVYVKHKGNYLPVCTGFHAEQLHTWIHLLEHAKEGMPTKKPPEAVLQLIK